MQRIDKMVRRPTILQIAPRRYRIDDIYYVPIGQDVRPAGLGLIATSIAAFVFLDIDFARDPLMPAVLFTLGVLGVVILIRAPLWRQRRTLLEVDMSAGTMVRRVKSHNGSGEIAQEIAVSEVDELLFAMRDSPIDGRDPNSVKVDAFATYVRTLEGELVPVIEASLDHDRTFRVAVFLADMLNVGIKQVGKGWRG